MSLIELIVYVAIGLIGGGSMGFTLGAESTKWCTECLRNGDDRYRAGHQAGYRDGVEMTVERVRKLGVEAKNTYTITKGELERIERETLE